MAATNRNDYFYDLIKARLEPLLQYENGLKIADEYSENATPSLIIYLGTEGNTPNADASLDAYMLNRGCDFTINLFLRRSGDESTADARTEANEWIDRLENSLIATTPNSYTHTISTTPIYTLNCKAIVITETDKFYATKTNPITGIQVRGQIQYSQTYY